MGEAFDYRSTHVNKVVVNEDGTIEQAKGDKFGVEQLFTVDPYKVNEAETISYMGGVNTIKVKESRANYFENMAVTDIESGGWLAVSGVDFGDAGAEYITVNVSAKSDAVIKVCLDKNNCEAIAYIEVEKNDGFITIKVPITKTVGKHDVIFVFDGKDILFDSWVFEQSYNPN